jgi:hypothetical protein
LALGGGVCGACVGFFFVVIGLVMNECGGGSFDAFDVFRKIFSVCVGKRVSLRYVPYITAIFFIPFFKCYL